MRCVDKGVNLTPYAKYRDAMPYLVERIGAFCSYCEMEISNETDVEHVKPKSLGGAELLLENFLLGCKKCNKIKSNKNPSRANHLWPDEDNTFVAYEYVNEIVVQPSDIIKSTPIETLARNTLTLTGIDRLPWNSLVPPKEIMMDRRWQKRREAWGRAELALQRWRNNPTDELCEQIGDTAVSLGFFSIWVKFFSGPDEAKVLAEIRSRFQNTYDPVKNLSGEFVLRSDNARF